MAIRQHHKEFLNLATIAIDEQDFTHRDISGLVFNFDQRQIPKAKKMIQEFREQMLALSESSEEQNSVYRLSVQLFRLDKEPKK